MTESTPPATATQNEAPEETITFVVYEETSTTYQVPVQHLLDLDLPATPGELSDTTELHLRDIDDETLFEALEGIEPTEYAVQERQISFPAVA